MDKINLEHDIAWTDNGRVLVEGFAANYVHEWRSLAANGDPLAAKVVLWINEHPPLKPWWGALLGEVWDITYRDNAYRTFFCITPQGGSGGAFQSVRVSFFVIGDPEITGGGLVLPAGTPFASTGAAVVINHAAFATTPVLPTPDDISEYMDRVFPRHVDDLPAAAATTQLTRDGFVGGANWVIQKVRDA